MQFVALLGSETYDAGRDGQRPVGMIDVGGIEVARRVMRAAQVAGAEQLLVVSEDPTRWQPMLEDRVIRRMIRTQVASEAGLDEGGRALRSVMPHLEDTFVAIPGDRVITHGAAKRLAQAAGPAVMYDHAGEVIAARLARRDIEAATESGEQLTSLEALAAWAVRERGVARIREEESPEMMQVRTAADGREAKQRLFKTLRKPFDRQADGLTAYFINRPVSLACSRLLVHTPITPNQITTFDLLLGLVAGVLLASGQWEWIALGAFLMQLVSIFDGIDGELARMKLLMSHAGALYDSVGDDIIKLTMFISLGISSYKIFGDASYQWATIAGSLFTVATVGVLYVEMIRMGSGTLNSTKWFFEEEGREPTLFQKFLVGFSYILKRDTYTLLLMLIAALGAPHVSFGVMFVGITIIFVTTYLQRIQRVFKGSEALDDDEVRANA